MHRYKLFGGCLASELVFPELSPHTNETASWTLRVDRDGDYGDRGQLLGTGTEPNCEVQLFARGETLILEHSCTGRFTIANRGREIAWTERPNVPLEAVRADVIGRVMAVALHAMGLLPLHASAVALSGKAIGFLAAKGTGKSTLAVALTAAGGQLITDDLLPVQPSAPACVCGGIQSARLNHDSAAQLGKLATQAPRGVDGKYRIGQLPTLRLWSGRAPLAALYLLTPYFDAGGVIVERRKLSPRMAAFAIATHCKVGALLGTREAGAVLTNAAAIAITTPVYELSVSHRFEDLPQAVAQLVEWHRLSSAPDVECVA